jgi:hypothetical protein
MDFGFKFLNQRTTGSICLLGKSEPKNGPFWVLGVYWGSQNQRASGSEYFERSESKNHQSRVFGEIFRIK